MNNHGNEFKELVALVEKFVEFADELKRNGKINEEQYAYITKNKIEFLKESQETFE